ncbi:hypothetical protein N658DRAFT_483228 [Parathielavia hyrcaniae]|uniref:Uncharacterized protein n=1 Tax=Parathielavia hyrcaniae TaxID=113614 RepID=A0AAN6QCN6_9PEZI|nr:hypothetical protein N658DRAFT_483228 [Parathielavia hyrcaniae]
MAPALKPLRAFHNIEEWANRHRAGTEAEFAADQKMIEQINKENNKFRAWILSKTRQTPKRIEYLVVVQFGPDGERNMPQQGEPARLRVVFADNTATRSWDCRRIENPVALTSFKTDSAEKLATYHVTVHIADSHDGIHPLIDTTPASRTTPESPAAAAKSNDAHSDLASSSHDVSGISDCSPVAFLQKGDAGKLALTVANAVHVNFWMTASEATKNAELDALEHFCGRHKGNVSERQEKAFEYFVLLRNPDFYGVPVAVS